MSPDRPAAGPRCVVVGAYVADCLVRTGRLPVWGDDITADSIRTTPGGKGTNQAVALARLGAQVTAVGTVGSDAVGSDLVTWLRTEGIDTTYVERREKTATPVCFVFTDDAGRDAILWRIADDVAVTAETIRAAEPALDDAAAVLITFEVPPTTVDAAIRAANRHGARVVVNPAPLPADSAAVADLPWHLVDVLVPNETEARALLSPGPAGAELAAEQLAQALGEALGVPVVCVTLADQGCVLWDGAATTSYPAPPVEVLDPVGASDAFTAALALDLISGTGHDTAIRRALEAASFVISHPGTAESMPTTGDLQARIMRQ